MKNKILTNIKSLFTSCVNSKELFEWRKKSFIFHFIVLILILCAMTIPQYTKAKSVTGEEVMQSFPDVEEAFSELFTISLDCKVTDSKLVCSDTAEEINRIMGTSTEYTVIVNTGTYTTPIDVTYETPLPTDNLILLLENNIKVRYCERDKVNKKIKVYEIIGGYTELNGFDFTEMTKSLNENPDSLNQEITSFMQKIYLSTIESEGFSKSLSSSVVSFGLFLLTTALILRFPTLFKRSKGFKFGECIKISLISAFPLLFIAAIFSLILTADFSFIFMLLYVIRILYIYIRYLSSKQHGIYNTLYKETKEERFNV